jgi:large subunit ribosomal protein L19
LLQNQKLIFARNSLILVKNIQYSIYNLKYIPLPLPSLKIRVMDAVKFVHEQLSGKKDFPKFKPGDNITVNYKIIEGNKERIQSFKGDVIKRQGTGHTASFTVRKISDGIGVERVFPIGSPNIESIVLNKAGNVSKAKLFYQRKRSGKSARIREKRMVVGTTAQ